MIQGNLIQINVIVNNGLTKRSLKQKKQILEPRASLHLIHHYMRQMERNLNLKLNITFN